MLYFGTEAQRVLVPSLDDVFTAVQSGTSRYGVAAVENSTEGSVARTIDLLATSNLMICGELTLTTHHALLSAAVSLHEIRCVRAHAQALAQCHAWLSLNLPHAAREGVASNADGARMAKGDPTAAAIASVRSALQYDLPVLFQDIQDVATNQTRFLVLGHHDCEWSSNAKTSLVFSVENKPGALYEALEPLHRHGVSMCRLESRPSRLRAWEYSFYIDMVGHKNDPPVALALEELGKIAQVRVLGSYTVKLM
jgi:chorismate mutase/prephenate dehydratase